MTKKAMRTKTKTLAAPSSGRTITAKSVTKPNQASESERGEALARLWRMVAGQPDLQDIAFTESMVAAIRDGLADPSFRSALIEAIADAEDIMEEETTFDRLDHIGFHLGQFIGYHLGENKEAKRALGLDEATRLGFVPIETCVKPETLAKFKSAAGRHARYFRSYVDRGLELVTAEILGAKQAK